MKYKTEQEEFWASQDWGDRYIERNNIKKIKNYIHLFSHVLEKTDGSINSVLEFGSNIGLNLHAINTLLDKIDISAIEINAQAVGELKKLNFIDKIYHESILNFEIDRKRDFVFIKGVLIHINPDSLETVYEKLYEASNKYIFIAEYYNPTPIMVPYRGENDKLFKRDFAGEMMDKYPDLRLIDYGFCYHRDNNFPMDDVNWFLLKK